jgi:osmoprotectant transport system ATP-binding protein
MLTLKRRAVRPEARPPAPGFAALAFCLALCRARRLDAIDPKLMAAAIRLNAVSKRYSSGGVGPLSLEVAARTTVALVGSSGAGKSTVLRLLVGLLAPDEGEVIVAGQCMRADTAAALRLRMGYLIQDGGLFPHLSARANASIVALHLGWSTARIDARLSELLDLTRLPRALLDHFPAELSGGERQRVALVRALFLDPEVLLLDEPLGALDALVRARLQEELGEMFRALEKTVLFVTHDLAEAAFLADEIVVMDAGVIVESASAADIVEHPRSELARALLAAHRVLPRGCRT